MSSLKQADKAQVIDILAAAFESNPSVNWVLPKEGNRSACLRSLMKYAVDVTSRQHEIFLHDEAPAVALCHFPHSRRFSVADVFSDLEFVLKVTGVKGALRAARREAMVKAMHPRTPFLYLWMLGVSPVYQGRGAGSALLKKILARCDEESLPAYLETSVERNLPLYQRHGFGIYHELKLEGLHMRFMKREPVKQKSG